MAPRYPVRWLRMKTASCLLCATFLSMSLLACGDDDTDLEDVDATSSSGGTAVSSSSGGGSSGAPGPSSSSSSSGALEDGGPSDAGHVALAWENPTLQGDDLVVVWGTSSADVWAGGSNHRGSDPAVNGVLLRGSGSTWNQVETHGVRDVWGSAANDVWVASNTFVRHWNGAAWDYEREARAASLWGAAANDVWAAGGGISHWNGTA